MKGRLFFGLPLPRCRAVRLTRAACTRYTSRNMTATAEKIEQEFKKLKPRDQVEFLERLEFTVFGEDVEDEALGETLERRMQEIRSGKVRGIPAEQTFKRIKKRYA